MKSHIRALYWSLSLLALINLIAWPHAWAQESLDDRTAAVVKTEILAVGVPGVSVAVMRDGKMLLEQAWGQADIEKNVAASTSTVYPVGSLTKQFTAALLLKQVDRGRLALTDPLGKHFAGLSAEAGAIPIEQLLNHTSGLKRSAADPETRFEKMSADSLLAKVLRDKLETKPGTTWTYSNAGYTVLGVLVEKLYGKPYATALLDEIATPLQLATLRKCEEPKPGDATGYMRAQSPSPTLGAGGKPGQPPGFHYSQDLGAGGICSTAADLVRWTHALHTGRVLSPASYQAMITPRGAAAVASKYGFGLSVWPAAWGHNAIWHDGQSITGHAAELNWYPQDSLAVAVVYNGYPLVRGVADRVARIVLGLPLPEKKAEPAAPTPKAAAPSTPATPADRATLTGVYELAPQRTFEVTLENGELYVTAPGGGKQPLVFRSGNSYMRDADIITFIIENGVVTGFEVEANGNKRVLRKIK